MKLEHLECQHGHESIEVQTFRLLMEEASKNLRSLQGCNAPGVPSYIVEIGKACERRDAVGLASVTNRMHAQLTAIKDYRKRQRGRFEGAAELGEALGSILVVAFFLLIIWIAKFF